MHHFEKIIVILIKLEYFVYFCLNAANDYWVISMKQKNRNKTDFLTSNDQWMYLRMNQELKEASHTYVQFSNLIFDSLPLNDEKIFKFIIFINDYDDHAFAVFMNDHDILTKNYESMFCFLHENYFFKCVFKSVYLFEHKMQMFSNSLKMLDFQDNASKLRLLMKYKNKILNWLIFTDRGELNTFL